MEDKEALYALFDGFCSLFLTSISNLSYDILKKVTASTVR